MTPSLIRSFALMIQLVVLSLLISALLSVCVWVTSSEFDDVFNSRLLCGLFFSMTNVNIRKILPVKCCIRREL